MPGIFIHLIQIFPCLIFQDTTLPNKFYRQGVNSNYQIVSVQLGLQKQSQSHVKHALMTFFFTSWFMTHQVPGNLGTWSNFLQDRLFSWRWEGLSVDLLLVFLPRWYINTFGDSEPHTNVLGTMKNSLH